MLAVARCLSSRCSPDAAPATPASSGSPLSSSEEALQKHTAHLEARCHVLAAELDHRGTALYQLVQREHELLAQIKELKELARRRREKLVYLQSVMESAVQWQRRGWLTRALHKWRVPKRA